MSWPIVGADDAVAERYFGLAESSSRTASIRTARWTSLVAWDGIRRLHDQTPRGFCIFESAHTDFDVGMTPAGTDYAAAVAAAARAAGCRLVLLTP